MEARMEARMSQLESYFKNLKRGKQQLEEGPETPADTGADGQAIKQPPLAAGFAMVEHKVAATAAAAAAAPATGVRAIAAVTRAASQEAEGHTGVVGHMLEASDLQGGAAATPVVSSLPGGGELGKMVAGGRGSRESAAQAAAPHSPCANIDSAPLPCSQPAQSQCEKRSVSCSTPSQAVHFSTAATAESTDAVASPSASPGSAARSAALVAAVSEAMAGDAPAAAPGSGGLRGLQRIRTFSPGIVNVSSKAETSLDGRSSSSRAEADFSADAAIAAAEADSPIMLTGSPVVEGASSFNVYSHPCRVSSSIDVGFELPLSFSSPDCTAAAAARAAAGDADAELDDMPERCASPTLERPRASRNVCGSLVCSSSTSTSPFQSASSGHIGYFGAVAMGLDTIGDFPEPGAPLPGVPEDSPLLCTTPVLPSTSSSSQASSSREATSSNRNSSASMDANLDCQGSMGLFTWEGFACLQRDASLQGEGSSSSITGGGGFWNLAGMGNALDGGKGGNGRQRGLTRSRCLAEQQRPWEQLPSEVRRLSLAAGTGGVRGKAGPTMDLRSSAGVGLMGTKGQRHRQSAVAARSSSSSAPSAAARQSLDLRGSAAWGGKGKGTGGSAGGPAGGNCGESSTGRRPAWGATNGQVEAERLRRSMQKTSISLSAAAAGARAGQGQGGDGQDSEVKYSSSRLDASHQHNHDQRQQQDQQQGRAIGSFQLQSLDEEQLRQSCVRSTAASGVRSSIKGTPVGRKASDQLGGELQLGCKGSEGSGSSSAAAVKLQRSGLTEQTSPLRASLGRLSVPGESGVRSAAAAKKEGPAAHSRLRAVGAANISSNSSVAAALVPNRKEASGSPAGSKAPRNQPLLVKAQHGVARTKGASPQVKVKTAVKLAAGTVREDGVRCSRLLGISPATGETQHMGHGTAIRAKGRSGNWGEALGSRPCADDGTPPKRSDWRKF